MPFSADAIANYFIDRAKECDAQAVPPLTPMKVQKLVYYANGWHLAIKDEPLINEPIEAWRFGPVIHSLYREFKGFGEQPVSRHARNARYCEGQIVPYEPSLQDESPDEATRQFVQSLLDKVWEIYSPYTAIQLYVDTDDGQIPLLVRHQYGRGHAWILASGGTWRWQMSLPVEDQSHETFWRQLLRALVAAAPENVSLTASSDAANTTVTLRAEFRDDAFLPVDDIGVSAVVTHEDGDNWTVTLEPSPDEPGVFSPTLIRQHRVPGILKRLPSAMANRSMSRAPACTTKPARQNTSIFAATRARWNACPRRPAAASWKATTWRRCPICCAIPVPALPKPTTGQSGTHLLCFCCC